MKLESGQKILFIGDSITACMRDTAAPPLGAGYVQFLSCLLAARHPELDVELMNRGIDGNTIVDLERRWAQDVLAEAPDRLFIMIGVNDVLYRNIEDKKARAVSDEQYRETLVRLIERTLAALDCRIVLLEPNPVEEHLQADSHAVMRKLVEILRDVGARFALDVVDIFDRFYRTIERGPHRGWLVDVPHPNLYGHMVMALAVLDYLEG